MGKHSTGETSSTTRAPGGRHHDAAGTTARDTRHIQRATREARARTSRTSRGGKPSVVGHATSGAATGASLGALAGSVVPGVGTAVGAAAGAGVGGAAGAAGGASAKRAYRLAQRSPATRALVAEFIACVLILALSPMTDKHRSDTPGQWMKRATGISALFVVLGMVAAIGPKAGRVAAGFGGLVLVTLAVSDRDVFATIAARFGGPLYSGPKGPDDTSGTADGGGGADGDFGDLPGVPDGGSTPTGVPPSRLPPWRGPF